MTRTFRIGLIGTAATLLALPALAQTAPASDPHAAHGARTAAAAPANATEAYAAAMDKMHQGMMVAPTGDADVDFVRGMIAHHQGAIDMARIQLEFGKDPQLRKLSEDIIAAQEKEIAQMQAWLATNAPDAANADAAKMESMTANPATGAPPKPSPAGTPEPSPAGTPTPKPAN